MTAARVTIADVAREAGVSSQTVSRVINNKGEIRAETREAVMAVITRLGYRPSSIARGLATNRTYTIGLSVPDIANPFWPEIARGVEDVAWERGYHIFLCNTTETPEREESVLRMFEDKRVDGVIVCGARQPDDRLLPLINKHPAAVLVNRTLAGSGAGCVIADSHLGAVTAMRHLLGGGRRRIAFLAGPPTSQNGRRHMSGYRDALQAAGLLCDEGLIVPCLPYIEGGLLATRALLADRPDVDAIYCYNDLIAFGALQACAEIGRRVPEEIAVVGFDDILLAQVITPALTTLHVPKYDIGAHAARMLLAMIEGRPTPGQVVVEPQLVIRASAP
jgi:LacI family transcriptional regulator